MLCKCLMKRFFILYLVFIFCSLVIQAQGDLDNQDKIFYRNEKSLAFMLNSNGWGLNGRYAKRKDAANKIFYDIDFATIKHPKEVRRVSSISPSSQSYILGKQYVVFDFRFGYGKQKEIYRKFDVGGVSVRRFHSIGPSVSILKPIYYQVYYNQNQIEIERFNVDRSDNIIGKASFLQGINELLVVPGGFVKLGVSFEYSRIDQVIHSIDVGVIGEAFIQKLPIMATKANSWFFLTLYASYRIGKVVDPNARKLKHQKEDFLN
jgi:hypothetical protein